MVDMESSSMPYSDQLEILRFPGNDRCVDCGATFAEWAAVNFGIVLCIKCAGKHRSLGVAISVVRSFTMDSWSVKHINMMKAGGNGKWSAVCMSTGLVSLPVLERYSAKVGNLYAQRIFDCAAEQTELSVKTFLNDIQTSTENSSFSQNKVKDLILVHDSRNENQLGSSTCSPPTVKDSHDVLRVKCTICHCEIPLEELDSHSIKCQILTCSSEDYEAQFHGAAENRSLGLSLTKCKSGNAFVSHVVPSGQAESQNVSLGSVVIAVNGKPIQDFHTVIELAKSSPPPLTLRFRRNATSSNGSLPKSNVSQRTSAHSPTKICSVPEPVVVTLNITVKTEALGFRFERKRDTYVVISVDKDSHAGRTGLLVGSKIIGVNGRTHVPLETISLSLQSGQRPLSITFHRVEGLMRAWK